MEPLIAPISSGLRFHSGDEKTEIKYNAIMLNCKWLRSVVIINPISNIFIPRQTSFCPPSLNDRRIKEQALGLLCTGPGAL